jgi:hypothetical protein
MTFNLINLKPYLIKCAEHYLLKTFYLDYSQIFINSGIIQINFSEENDEHELRNIKLLFTCKPEILKLEKFRFVLNKKAFQNERPS